MRATARKKPVNVPRIHHPVGGPIFWALMQRRGRTFPGDAGDVPDITGRSPAGVRTSGCSWSTGQFGPCLTFGSSGTLAVTPDFPASATSATFSGWIRSATASSYSNSPLYLNPSGPNETYWLYPTSLAYISVLDTGRPIGALTVSVDVTQWHLMTVTTAPGAGNYKLYLDGQLLGTGTQNAVALPATCYLGMGSFGSHWTGAWDNIQLFDYALSPAEIAHDYADPFWRLRRSRRSIFANVPPMTVPGAAALTCTATIAAAGSLLVPGSAALTCTTTIAAAGSVAYRGSAALSCTTTLAASPSLAIPGSAALLCTSSLTASSGDGFFGAAALAAATTLTTAGTLTYFGAAPLTAAATLTAAGTLGYAGAAALSCTASLFAVPFGAVTTVVDPYRAIPGAQGPDPYHAIPG